VRWTSCPCRQLHSRSRTPRATSPRRWKTTRPLGQGWPRVAWPWPRSLLRRFTAGPRHSRPPTCLHGDGLPDGSIQPEACVWRRHGSYKLVALTTTTDQHRRRGAAWYVDDAGRRFAVRLNSSAPDATMGGVERRDRAPMYRPADADHLQDVIGPARRPRRQRQGQRTAGGRRGQAHARALAGAQPFVSPSGLQRWTRAAGAAASSSDGPGATARRIPSWRRICAPHERRTASNFRADRRRRHRRRRRQAESVASRQGQQLRSRSSPS